MSVDKKYELTDETKVVAENGNSAVVVRRIRALKSFRAHTDKNLEKDNGVFIQAGDLGGWVQSADNLSQDGTCWIDDEAIVLHEAFVSDDAYVADHARILDFAAISNSAHVAGHSLVCDHVVVTENARIFDHAVISDITYIGGNAVVTDRSRVWGSVRIVGDTYIMHTSRVYGDAYIRADELISKGKPCYVYIKGSADISGDAIIISSGNIHISDSVIIDEEAVLHGNIDISGQVHITGNATIGAESVDSGTIRIGDKTVLGDAAKIQCSKDVLYIGRIESQSDQSITGGTTFYRNRYRRISAIVCTDKYPNGSRTYFNSLSDFRASFSKESGEAAKATADAMVALARACLGDERIENTSNMEFGCSV
jgi:carbonic anhydrase/acetyltransferase-like protein (isoleucine patch superfamily)